MAEKALTLSIVIPAYNEEDHIKACLESIAGQTEVPDEVIVVNNNSSDKTAEIAGAFPFVTLLHEKRQGLRFTRDTGLNSAKGEIMGRIDADTQLAPDWVANARRVFGDDSVMAATGPCYYHDMPKKQVGFVLDKLIRRTLFFFDKTPLLYGSNMVLRRSAWRDIYDGLCTSGDFFEDYDITIHLREKHHRIVFDDNLIVGVSSRRLEDSPAEFRKNMRLHIDTFAQHGQRSAAARGGRMIYLSSYPLLKLLRRAYDPEKQRVSLKKLTRSKSRPRPNANT